MTIGRVCPHHENNVRLHHGIKRLRTGRFPQGLLQAITGRAMANPGAGIYVVSAKHRTNQLLCDIHFFISTAAGGNAAHGRFAIFGLNTLDFTGGVINRLVPAHFLPGVMNTFTDHRRGNSVSMGGIAPGKTAFDTTMTMVGATFFTRCHTHNLFAFHFGIKAATHATIRTSRGDLMFWRTRFNHGFFHQGRGRAGLHTRAARHTFGLKEIFATGRDLAVKATALNRQGECALGFFTGAHTTRADNTFGRIKSEIGIGFVFRLTEVVFTIITITYFAQSHRSRHVLQFAITIGSTGQAIQWMV